MSLVFPPLLWIRYIRNVDRCTDTVIDAEPIYTANYSITGIPESFYQASEIILELTHENLKAIEYSVGTECVDPKTHDVNEPLSLLLENFHTKRGLKSNGTKTYDKRGGEGPKPPASYQRMSETSLTSSQKSRHNNTKYRSDISDFMNENLSFGSFSFFILKSLSLGKFNSE